MSFPNQYWSISFSIDVNKNCVEIDYPHSDANWPNAPENLLKEFEAANISDDDINAMTHLNAMREFQYDPFSYRAREKCTVEALRLEAIDIDTRPTPKGRRFPHRKGLAVSELNPTA